jgi:acetyl esterase/lipase
MSSTFDRRTMLLAGAWIAAAPAATAVADHSAETADTVELWPAGVPGGERVSAQERIEDLAPGAIPRDRVAWHVTRPLLSVFTPRRQFNGITLLVIPGGGYRRVVIDREGFDSAEWFCERGYAAAVLRYRLPADGWSAGPDAPVHDAMRALRLLRAHAPSAKAGPAARIGVIGFSAGGHLAARLVSSSAPDYAHVDAADERDARADFATLMYPVIALAGGHSHPGSVQQFIAAGVESTDEALSRYSAHLSVTRRTPPTQLIHAADDASVPVENSLMMYDALRRAGVRSELHVFDGGGHGFGLRGLDGKTVAIWPSLVHNWAQSHAAAS